MDKGGCFWVRFGWEEWCFCVVCVFVLLGKVGGGVIDWEIFYGNYWMDWVW
jgi:hypothetical protein